MNTSLGLAVVAAAALVVLVAARGSRSKRQTMAVDVALAAGGAGLALGGLLLLDDVGTWSWVAAPLGFAIMTPLHVRALFAGEGPFRT